MTCFMHKFNIVRIRLKQSANNTTYSQLLNHEQSSIQSLPLAFGRFKQRRFFAFFHKSSFWLSLVIRYHLSSLVINFLMSYTLSAIWFLYDYIGESASRPGDFMNVLIFHRTKRKGESASHPTLTVVREPQGFSCFHPKMCQKVVQKWSCVGRSRAPTDK